MKIDIVDIIFGIVILSLVVVAIVLLYQLAEATIICDSFGYDFEEIGGENYCVRFVDGTLELVEYQELEREYKYK